MIKILFVCHGNICRSPMAEFVLKDMVKKAGLEHDFAIASAATSTEELGNPVYPPVGRILAEHGIDCSGKTARQLTCEDYDAYDLLIAFDRENLYCMNRMLGGDPDGKIRLLLDFAGRPGDAVSDPWYTRDFAQCWQDVNFGCTGLLKTLTDKVSIDFSRCTDRQELYAELREKMDWQSWYGENLDALWDILTGLPHSGHSFAVTLPGEDAPESVRSYARKIVDLFREAGMEITEE